MSPSSSQSRQLARYYKWHAPIYDATRWSFLFGRRRLIHMLPSLPGKPHILEVGCGTGRNLKRLSRRYPKADITGIDLARPMLRHAARQTSRHNSIRLVHGQYGQEKLDTNYDLILLSYSLTMMSPIMMQKTLTQLHHDLGTGGCVAVVDFHRTPLPWFRYWMSKNHVTMNDGILPRLQKKYHPVNGTVHPAYFGLWSYFLFVGARDGTSYF